MSGFWLPPDDFEYQQSGGIGSAHSVDADSPDFNAVQELRKVVAEITGQPEPERKMGFY